MPNSTTLSALESLLLFQYLYSYGISTQVFAKIADHLRNDPLVRAESGFDAARLNPDVLREFFLRLIKDESKDTATSAAADPDSAIGSSRKRKAPSPSLPSLQDAIKDSHLIPSLITKLYARFRDQTVTEIRKEETRYDALLQDIAEIQRGDWDARLLEELEEGQKSHIGVSKSNGETRSMAVPSKSPDKAIQQIVDAKSLPQPGKQISSTANIEAVKNIPRQPSVALPPSRLGQPQTVAGSTLIAQPTRTLTTSTPVSPGSRSSTSLEKSPNVTATQPILPNKPLQPLSTTGQTRPLPQQVVPKPPLQQSGSSARFPPSAYPNSPGAASTTTTPIPRVIPPQANSPHVAQRGGVMLQPFQVSPQVPSQIQLHQLQTPSTASTAQRKTSPTPRASQANFTPDTKPRLGMQAMAQILANPSLSNTPLQSPSAAGTPADPWKISPPDLHSTRPASPERPRSVSPLSDRAATPEPTPAVARTRRSKRGDAHNSDATPATGRSVKASSRRLRGASTASSVVASSARGRTRSQSIISQASADQQVKAEPSTPAADASDVLMTDGTPMAAPSQVITRRTGTLRGKRKRSATVASEAASEATASRVPLPPMERPNTVLAVRNFSRLSNPIMNDITSHKRASLFSMPVRERDAEGYGSMIRRPTDLKTIKAAIAAGARAVNAAVEDHPEAASAPALLLPWSEELVPPKAIVNSAQLERELMRMFANAVMFNPGEDEVVADSKEMFESVEINLANFREAERGAEVSVFDVGKVAESDVDGDGHEEEHAGTGTAVGKRRRLG